MLVELCAKCTSEAREICELRQLFDPVYSDHSRLMQVLKHKINTETDPKKLNELLTAETSATSVFESFKEGMNLEAKRRGCDNFNE